jgi:hypothetical protein
MLAARMPTILPDMAFNEAVDLTRVHSVAGLVAPGSGLLTRRPFRAPHHSISVAGSSDIASAVVCGTTSGGPIECWGHPTNLESFGPFPTGSYVMVEVASRWACALTTVGGIYCWGDVSETYEAYGILEPPIGVFTSITLGEDFGLALDDDTRFDLHCPHASAESTEDTCQDIAPPNTPNYCHYAIDFCTDELALFPEGTDRDGCMATLAPLFGDSDRPYRVGDHASFADTNTNTLGCLNHWVVLAPIDPAVYCPMADWNPANWASVGGSGICEP